MEAIEGRSGGRIRRSASWVLAISSLFVGVVWVDGHIAVHVASAASATSRFVPLAPARILDTRIGLGAPAAEVAGGGSIDLQVSGVGGVPASGATAVAFNLTVTETRAAGFFTAWPAGSARPVVSNLNATGPRQTIANLVIVALPPSGQVSLYSQSGAHLVADVAGYWTESASAKAGRFISMSPSRVLDTRVGNGASGPVGAQTTIDVTIAGRAGLNSTGIAAVIMNVTITDAAGPGFVTVWPTGETRPTASVLNAPEVASTVPNLVIVPLGAGGQVSLFTQTGGQLVADVAGYFTDDTATDGTDGLFVPLSPTRILDTRSDQPVSRVWPGQRRDVVVAGLGGVPSTGVAAAVLNLTGTEANNPGFVTAYPAVTERPNASNLNLASAGATRANLAAVSLGLEGRVSLFSQSGVHMIADVAGYFLGSLTAATPGVPIDAPPPPAPPLVAPPLTHNTAACRNIGGYDGNVRIEVNPGLANYLTATDWAHADLGTVQTMASTFMANSGVLAAFVGGTADFNSWISRMYVFEGALFGVSQGSFLRWLASSYHEAIHGMQRGCIVSTPTTGYLDVHLGPPQSSIYQDVIDRINALLPDGSLDTFFCRDSALEIADGYLKPGDPISAQGLESQMWEINAYVNEFELQRALEDSLHVSGVMNTGVVSAKLHQLSRYLHAAEAVPGLWDQMRAAGAGVALADQWNLAVRTWRAANPPEQYRGCWDLAFGPDAEVITRFTLAAAGTVAPPRP